MRRTLIAGALLMTIAACGGNGSQPIAGDPSTTGPTTAGTATTAAPTTTTTTAAPTTTTTTTTIAPAIAVFDDLATGDFEPFGGEVSAVGTPDEVTRAAIVAGLLDQGVDLTGIELWVLPIVGTGDQMLVMTADPAADQVADDSENELLSVLADLDVLADSAITRFTLHYYDSDEEGDFVLTTTMPIDVFFDLSLDGSELPEDEVGIQFQRLDGGTP